MTIRFPVMLGALLLVAMMGPIARAGLPFEEPVQGRYNGYSTKPNSPAFGPRFRVFVRENGLTQLLYSAEGFVAFYLNSDGPATKSPFRVVMDQTQNGSSVATGKGRLFIRPRSFNYKLSMVTNTSPKKAYVLEARFNVKGKVLKGTMTTRKSDGVTVRHIRCVRVATK